MELLLFIYALQGGITGNAQSDIEPVIYAQVEAGVQLNDLFILGCLYTEIDFYNKQTENRHFIVKIYADYENFNFGMEYDYNIDFQYDLLTIYFRLQSWGE